MGMEQIFLILKHTLLLSKEKSQQYSIHNILILSTFLIYQLIKFSTIKKLHFNQVLCARKLS
jgi:hypothetical protein